MDTTVWAHDNQELSMLETVFSKHLSAKMFSGVNDHVDIKKKTHHQFKRYHYKRLSQIPLLSARVLSAHIVKKKTRQQDGLARALEAIHISKKPTTSDIVM